MGRRNHYFHIATTDFDKNTPDFPPATDEGGVWESASGFYERKGNQKAADSLCEKGHPAGNATVRVTWELPFGHKERLK